MSILVTGAKTFCESKKSVQQFFLLNVYHLLMIVLFLNFYLFPVLFFRIDFNILLLFSVKIFFWYTFYVCSRSTFITNGLPTLTFFVGSLKKNTYIFQLPMLLNKDP